MHAESVAIARYIAEEVELAGNSKLENLKINSIVDALNDFSNSKCTKNFVSECNCYITL